MKKLNLFIETKLRKDAFDKLRIIINEVGWNQKHSCIKLKGIILQDQNQYEESTITNEFKPVYFYLENSKEEDVAKYPLRQEIRLNSVSNVMAIGEYEKDLYITGTVVLANSKASQ